MKPIRNWKKALALLTVSILSVMGVKSTSATTATPETQLAQSCSPNLRHSTPASYARVTLQRGTLNIRSSPNGRVIGSVPNGWQVLTLRKDTTGRWTRITSHLGDVGPNGFVSAPNFREGWVSTSLLRNLGRFCGKPLELQRSALSALSGNKKILVNEDWVQRGDRIASAIPKT